MQTKLTYSVLRMPLSDGEEKETLKEGGGREGLARILDSDPTAVTRSWAEGPTPYVRIVRHSLRCRWLVQSNLASFWDYWGPLQHLQAAPVEYASCLTRLPGA
jgi:DNA-directed RNA polymerase subunit H (RpoH/RPB5)